MRPDVSTALRSAQHDGIKREFVILRRAYLTNLRRIRSSGAFSLIIFLFLILHVLHMYTDCKIESESFAVLASLLRYITLYPTLPFTRIIWNRNKTADNRPIAQLFAAYLRRIAALLLRAKDLDDRQGLSRPFTLREPCTACI